MADVLHIRFEYYSLLLLTTYYSTYYFLSQSVNEVTLINA